MPAAAKSPSSLQTTASPPTTSITHCPPTCLRMHAAARHPRARDGSLEGAQEPPQLEKPPPLRKGRKMRMRPVRLRGPGWSRSHPLPPHPPRCSSFSKRMTVLTGRQRGPVHLPLHHCPTRRQLLGPPRVPRLEPRWRRQWRWPVALQGVTTGVPRGAPCPKPSLGTAATTFRRGGASGA